MKKNFQKSYDTIELGIVMHKSENMPVLKLTCKDVPYPNSPVLLNNKVIGKIDEILGTMEDVYASVILENKSVKIEQNCTLQAYKEKFMAKDRFLPRAEVEKKKEENDKKRNNNSKYGDDKKYKNDRKRTQYKKSNNDDNRGKRSAYGASKNYRQDNNRSKGDRKRYDEKRTTHKRFD